MFTFPVAIETSKPTIPTPAKASKPHQFIVPCVWRKDNSILSLLGYILQESFKPQAPCSRKEKALLGSPHERL
jgi:hypothetical protein